MSGSVPIFIFPALLALVWFLTIYAQAKSPSHQRPMRTSQFYRYGYSVRVRLPYINLPEFIVQLFGLAILVAALWGVLWLFFRDVETFDHENLNGHIAQKLARVETSCTHCHRECTAHDEDGNCTSYRSWCDHSVDYDWVLLTDYAEYFPAEGTIYIPRVDAQGVNEPPAWTAAYIGQPVTTLHSYRNLLRGGGDQSVFGFNPSSTLAKSVRALGQVPPRPQEVYQGWSYTPRLMIVTDANLGTRPATVEWDTVGFTNGFFGPQISGNILTQATYNTLLMQANAEAGPKVQANIQIIVCVSVCADTWADGVMDAWRGGAKNDVDIFIWVDTAWKPTNVAVRYGLPGEDESEEVGQGSNSLLAQTLASRLMLEVADIRNAAQVVGMAQEEVLAKFNRKPNKDFAHLEPGLHPSGGALIFMYVFGLLVGFGYIVMTSTYFMTEDPFGIE